MNQMRPPRRSLAQQIAVYTTSLVMAFVLLIGSASWLMLRHEQNSAYQTLLAKELELQARLISTRLQTIHGELAKAARSSLIATAMVDSAGKDTYLVPYLQGLRKVEGVALAVVFTDFEGKEIARNGEAGITDTHFSWLAQRLERRQPGAQIFGQGDDAELVVGEFVYYSRTSTPEGALLYRIRLADLVNPTVHLHWQNDGKAAATSLTRPLDVPDILAGYQLSIELQQSSLAALSTTPTLSILFMLMTVLVCLLAIWASRRIAQHMSHDLHQLSAFASDVIRSGFGSQRADSGDTHEVSEVASAINTMLDRLNELHLRLQRDSEAQFRTLVENLPGATYRCSADEHWTMDFISHGIEELSGYPASDFYHNQVRSFASIIHPDDLERVQQQVSQAVRLQQPFQIEYRIQRADGRVCWLWEKGRGIYDARGELSSLNGVLVDVTDRKRAEDALHEAKHAAEAASVAKSQFLATMSHEIRTPLNGVLGMAQLLLIPDLSEEERRDYIHTILNSGQALLTILNDILDLSRVESGRFELIPSTFEPRLLLEESCALFSEAARNKGLNLKASWLGEPHVSYRADAIRLRQIITNLVSNAIKFTDAGEITVDAQEMIDAHGHPQLHVAVSDTGIGIPEDKLNTIFDIFTQGDASNTRRHGGVGLGLALVRQLVGLMGGTVSVRSELGQGSTFWFAIPVGKADSTSLPDTPPPTLSVLQHMTSAGDTSLRRQQRILIVEDVPVNRLVVESVLDHLGYAHLSASNGAEAVALIEGGEAIDLVLMDCQMPVMDGFEATRRIRLWETHEQRPRPLPIVALTAKAFDKDRAQCLAAGMNDYLSKPLHVADLTPVLNKWLIQTHAKSLQNQAGQ